MNKMLGEWLWLCSTFDRTRHLCKRSHQKSEFHTILICVLQPPTLQDVANSGLLFYRMRMKLGSNEFECSGSGVLLSILLLFPSFFQAGLSFLSKSIAHQDVENIKACISDRKIPAHWGLAHKVEQQCTRKIAYSSHPNMGANFAPCTQLEHQPRQHCTLTCRSGIFLSCACLEKRCGRIEYLRNGKAELHKCVTVDSDSKSMVCRCLSNSFSKQVSAYDSENIWKHSPQGQWLLLRKSSSAM